MNPIHDNGQFPTSGFNGEARYNRESVSAIHGNAPRHISAPRVDRTLSRPQGAQPRPQFQGTTVTHRRPQGTAKHYESKGHDAALAHCQNHALPVSVQVMTSDTPIVGIIVRRDRFTVTIERDSLNNPGFVYHELIYKHAIETIKLPEFSKAAVH